MGSWFEKSLAFYASYHHNETNKLVHIVFVWQIFFTAQIFLFYASPPPAAVQDLLPSLSQSLSLPVSLPVLDNWALVCSLLYAVYYFFIEQPGLAGPLAAALVMTGYVVTKYLHHRFEADIWMYAIVVHVFAWVAQIYAHQVYEKRAPAFLDNIVQALVMAPLFVLLEVLFPLGYKPELHRQVEAIALKNIAEFRKSNKSQ